MAPGMPAACAPKRDGRIIADQPRRPEEAGQGAGQQPGADAGDELPGNQAGAENEPMRLFEILELLVGPQRPGVGVVGIEPDAEPEQADQPGHCAQFS
jgi:hypothetical protein